MMAGPMSDPQLMRAMRRTAVTTTAAAAMIRPLLPKGMEARTLSAHALSRSPAASERRVPVSRSCFSRLRSSARARASG